MENEERRPDQTRLQGMLDEQGVSPTDIETLTPVLLRLSEWPAPTATADQQSRLIARLTPLLPSVSPVRAAVQHSSFWRLLQTQVSLLRPAFWLLSVVIVGLGSVAMLSRLNFNQSLLLQALGPLLAYLSAVSAFRGLGLGTLEFELACPPSLLQLTIARLTIVLGYDVGLGLIMSLLLWSQGGGNVLTVTLHWLMPLLLVMGLALLLSLKLTMRLAAGLAYAGWLAALVLRLSLLTQETAGSWLTEYGESIVGGLGLLLIIFSLWYVRLNQANWLRHVRA